MKLRLVWLEKTKDRRIAEMLDDYLHRLTKYAKYDILELSSSRTQGERNIVLEAEAKSILSRLSPETYKVVLDEKGRNFTSAEVAQLLQQHQVMGTKEMAFIIGGHFGLADRVKAQANTLWALSALTFTHEMARLLLSEQLYRAFTIIHGHPYQK